MVNRKSVFFMVSYNTRQQIYSLNLASNVVTLEEGSQLELEDLAAKRLHQILSDSDVQKLIGEWEVVWGPAVYKYDGPIPILESDVADSVMYIAKSKDITEDDRYVIAIAATNAKSPHGWIVQDFWVNSTRLWNNGEPWKADPEDQTTPGMRVAAGASTGVRILSEDMQFDQKSLLDYLKGLTDSAHKPLSITTCGHSLGGALSPTLALSLMDRRSEWDRGKKATVSASPSAGATAGNDQFAAYYDEQLGKVTDRIWTYLDFVPHGWAQDTLEEARTFYEPYIKPTALIDLFVDFCLYLSISSGVEYKQICLDQEGFPGEYNPDAPNIFGDSLVGLLPKRVAKLILYSLGIENPEQKLIDALSDIIKPLIEELMEKSQSGKRALAAREIKISVEPYVQQIIEKLQTETSISKTETLSLNVKGLKNIVRLLLSSIWDFTKYLSQAVYQHTETYYAYMGVSEFINKMREYGVKL